MICWRCDICDPNRYTPHCIEVYGDPPASECYRLVMEDHARIAPNCQATKTRLNNSIAVDFLIRMVQ